MRLRIRVSIAALLAGSALFVPSLARASDLDAKTGAIVFAHDAVKTFGFESATELVAAKAAFTKYDTMSYPPKLTLTPITDASALSPVLTSGADAVEGSHGVRIGSIGTAPAQGLAILDDALFASLASGRVELTMWARADGATPSLQVQYGKPDWGMGAFDFATVTSTRTGRETSDGWVEYTTGAIDGSVWGAPIHAIVLASSAYGTAKGTNFVVDALEIKKAPGSNTEAKACTQFDVESTCGAAGECMYGHCVPSSVTWGVLPNPGFRQEFADRWAFFGSRVIGDRNSSEYGRTKMTPAARDLARYALSSRQYFGGMNRLVTGLHDNHTSFGSPPGGFSNFSPMLFFGWSGALHACFGVMEKDLLGGGLAFGVFHAGDKPITGVPLKPGDILTKIDGMEPKDWVDAVMPGINRTSTNDPRSAMGDDAENLSAAITARANTITITRCASSTKCTGDDKQEITIDVAKKMFELFTSTGGYPDSLDYFGCSPRFRDSVKDFDDAPQGEDAITPRTVDGIVDVQFDGFSGADPWKSKMSSIFDPKPPMVLMDARQGNGGLGDNVQHLLSLTRGKDEPIGFITVINGGWEEPSPANLLTTFGKCAGGGDTSAGGLDCFGAWGFFSADFTDPTGGKTKIAWLNTVDVSANDYMPRLLKGRSNLKIFSPVPTSGAFGAITSFAAFMPGWGGGSMQFQDSRFAPTFDDLAGARWESSHGVEGDVVVGQKQSDAMNGKDTMLEAAHAWLKEP